MTSRQPKGSGKTFARTPAPLWHTSIGWLFGELSLLLHSTTTITTIQTINSLCCQLVGLSVSSHALISSLVNPIAEVILFLFVSSMYSLAL
jgi:hypothetical protein